MTDTYFIGYDARENEAADVAAFSIRRRATNRVRVYKLEHRFLRSIRLFERPWRIEPDGQFYDMRDGRPFSTEFSHSRFLAFHLGHALGTHGPCMFVDCDWVFLTDPSPLMDMQRVHATEIGVVNRDRQVREGSYKMDGMVQQNYPRKLWSAMFTFMPAASWATMFDPGTVNTYPGRKLHSFLGLPDEEFWSIDPTWHFIPSLDDWPEEGPIRGVHFSEFSPWLNPDKRADYPVEFEAWEREREALYKAKAASSKPLVLWDDLSRDLVDISP